MPPSRMRLLACAAPLMLTLQTPAASGDELDLGLFGSLTAGDSIRVQVSGRRAPLHGSVVRVEGSSVLLRATEAKGVSRHWAISEPQVARLYVLRDVGWVQIERQLPGQSHLLLSSVALGSTVRLRLEPGGPWITGVLTCSTPDTIGIRAKPSAAESRLNPVDIAVLELRTKDKRFHRENALLGAVGLAAFVWPMAYMQSTRLAFDTARAAVIGALAGAAIGSRFKEASWLPVALNQKTVPPRTPADN